MNTVLILRRLWDRRVLTAVALVVGIIIAGAILYKPSFPPKSKAYTVGVATSQILVDTPNSEVTTIEPRGEAALMQPTSVMASLMVDGSVKALIAKDAGLRTGQLIGVNEALTTSQTASGLATPSQTVKPGSYVLSTEVFDDNQGNVLPIIGVTAQAPTAAGAAKLADAATTGLSQYVASQAAAEGVPVSAQLRVSSVGVSQTVTEHRGPSGVLAFLVFLLVSGLGCAMIVVAPGLRRAWRAAGGEPVPAALDSVGVRVRTTEFEYSRAMPPLPPVRQSHTSVSARLGRASEELPEAKPSTANAAETSGLTRWLGPGGSSEWRRLSVRRRVPDSGDRDDD
ncbi:MAG TPA: hypothetical protein VHV75_12885 [Solirubrobacteraceae bacterium]|jgi:hypothetical protein|nr:hypothetical protein [Solirubrobacteraceae bacterium]